MKFIFTVLAVLALSFSAQAIDQQAKAKCRSLHGMDADDATSFANSGCLLNCVIHGRVQSHLVSENSNCPLFPAGRCVNGQCLANSGPAKKQLGHIDVNMISASLANPANSYMAVCIQNSTTPMTLPIANRNQCVTCTSNPVVNSRTPVWNSVCANSGKYLFVNESRVSFEVFDHRGTGQNMFLGGASITIPQMLKNGDNNREIPLNIVGGNNAGTIKVRVTYTPRK